MKLTNFISYTSHTEVKGGNSSGDPALWKRSEEDAVGVGGLEVTDVASNQLREPENQ